MKLSKSQEAKVRSKATMKTDQDIKRMYQICNVKVGDRIKFKAVTRWSNRAVWRKINGFDLNTRPTVRFGGWGDFVVRLDEILEVKVKSARNQSALET